MLLYVSAIMHQERNLTLYASHCQATDTHLIINKYKCQKKNPKKMLDNGGANLPNMFNAAD